MLKQGLRGLGLRVQTGLGIDVQSFFLFRAELQKMRTGFLMGGPIQSGSSSVRVYTRIHYVLECDANWTIPTSGLIFLFEDGLID